MIAVILVLGSASAVAWSLVVGMTLAAPEEADGAGTAVSSGGRRHRVVERVAVALVARGASGDPASWLRVVVGAAVLSAGFGLARGGPVGAVVTVGVGIAALTVAAHATRGRGDRLADDHLPALLEHTSRGLRSGLDLRTALDGAAVRAGPHGPGAAAVVDRVDGGAGWDVALAGWAEDAARPPVRLVAAALALAAASGGRAAHALDGVAATLRSRRALAQEARSLATQARASAAVLVALPLVVSVGGAVADPRLADALLGTSWGLGCVVAAVVLDTVGALWMQRIVSVGSR